MPGRVKACGRLYRYQRSSTPTVPRRSFARLPAAQPTLELTATRRTNSHLRQARLTCSSPPGYASIPNSGTSSPSSSASRVTRIERNAFTAEKTM